MQTKHKIRQDDNSVSVVVSGILALMIVVSTSSAIFIWGLPYLQSLSDKQNLESMELQFDSVIDDINELIGGKSDGQNIFSLSADEGIITTQLQHYDRTVIYYSYFDNANYDFSISGFGDYDDWSFEFIDPPPPSLNKIIIRWYDDPDNINSYTDEEVLDPPPGLPAVIATVKEFAGRVCILLYEDVTHFGTIWLFDSNPVIYNLISSQGTYNLSMEKGGIIYSDGITPTVKRSFNILYEEDYLGLNILQTLSYIDASGGVAHAMNINAENKGTSILERATVYDIGLQIYGDYAQTWLDYIYNKYPNKFTRLDDDTLYMDESAVGSYLSFLNSVVILDNY